MIRIGLLGWWHVHAKDYAADANAHPDAELVATWDIDAQRGKAEAEKRGLRFYETLNDLLRQPDIDAVIVTTPTTHHCDVIVAAAQAGKHIFTEKVLAPTLQEANTILAAVEQHDVRLVVSMPRLYTGYTVALRQLVTDGVLGVLSFVRVRHSHDGSLRTDHNPDGWLPSHFYNAADSAGGALIDLGCHPLYLTRYFLGMPSGVNAALGSFTQRAVEDNAAVLMRYENGALGIAETSFTTVRTFTIELLGTLGAAQYHEPEGRLSVRTSRDQEWKQHPLSAPPSSAFEQWIAHIQQRTNATENLGYGLDLTILMEAAYRSAQPSSP